MKLQIVSVALLFGLMGFAALSIAQRGGRGGSEEGGSPLTVRSNGSGTAGSNVKDFLYGVVKAMDKDAMVLTKTNAGLDQTFKFTKKTKFVRDGRSSSLESLKLGDQVWVDARKDKKTSDLIARKVISGGFLMPSF